MKGIGRRDMNKLWQGEQGVRRVGGGWKKRGRGMESAGGLYNGDRWKDKGERRGKGGCLLIKVCR